MVGTRAAQTKSVATEEPVATEGVRRLALLDAVDPEGTAEAELLVPTGRLSTPMHPREAREELVVLEEMVVMQPLVLLAQAASQGVEGPAAPEETALMGWMESMQETPAGLAEMGARVRLAELEETAVSEVWTEARAGMADLEAMVAMVDQPDLLAMAELARLAMRSRPMAELEEMAVILERQPGSGDLVA